MALPRSHIPKLGQLSLQQPQSQLAREFELTDLQVTQIEEAFRLLAVRGSDSDPEEELGVLELPDVRRCLLALGLPFKPSSLALLISEPNQQYVTLRSFSSLAALLVHKRSRDRGKQPGRNGGTSRATATTAYPGENPPIQANPVPPSQAREAFRLFAKSRGQVQSHITLSTLRRVVRELREEGDEESLKAMILHANNENYNTDDAWMKGVSFEEFCAVMERTGAFR